MSFSLDLSDGLVELSLLFVEYEHEVKILDPEDARTIRSIIRELRLRARALENEVSRSRWNNRCRLQNAGHRNADTIIAAVETPGSNVRLFPIIHRPFSDGRNDGGRL
ncbi:MAG: hypothetical protein ABJG86_09850 [Nitratireductor sp.]|uniref:hypothetical protein n=1 Tax=Parvibaculum sp. TaxID=2024848 RepID=UPI00326E5476